MVIADLTGGICTSFDECKRWSTANMDALSRNEKPIRNAKTQKTRAAYGWLPTSGTCQVERQGDATPSATIAILMNENDYRTPSTMVAFETISL